MRCTESHYRGPGRRFADRSWMVCSVVKCNQGPQEWALVRSATQAETIDDRAVALDFGLLQVVEKPTALAHEQQQATKAVMVVLVLLEVLGEMSDPVAQQRHLDFRGTGVALGRGVLGDDLLLGLRVGTDRHAGSFRPFRA